MLLQARVALRAMNPPPLGWLGSAFGLGFRLAGSCLGFRVLLVGLIPGSIELFLKGKNTKNKICVIMDAAFLFVNGVF